MTKRAVIFANGKLADPNVVKQLILPDDFLVAADGGTHHIRQLDLTPSVIIGDIDSLTIDDRDWALDRGANLVQYKRDKDETDLELAIQFCVKQGYHCLLIVAALGGRMDQTLANLFMLNDPNLRVMDIFFDDGQERVFFVRNSCQVKGTPGDLLSLIPWGEKVTGIHTEGLRWSLNGETLYPEKTRGISNEMAGETVRISIGSGALLVVHRRNKQ